MGMPLFSRGNTAPPNPNPALFTIVREFEIRYPRLTVVMVNYPGCTTYGGNKISVYSDTVVNVRLAARLDPHFNDDSAEISPIARFPGDEYGWKLALQFVETLERNA